MSKIISSLSEISADYDILFCDLWGCVHDGLQPFPGAVSALRAFRAGGGVVVLVTNASRPGQSVRRHLRSIGAPDDIYDEVVSSGDATRAEIISKRWGSRPHLIGPPHDANLWDNSDVEPHPLEQADYILCSGLNDDENETPDDYQELIAQARDRDMMMLCANPDLIVDRGDRRIYCAGSIAQAYERVGGRTRYFGKPHAPIYELALRAAATVMGREPEKARILATGDGPLTDVAGPRALVVDCLFVSGGLAAGEVGDAPGAPDPALLAAYLEANAISPRYTIGLLG